MSKKNAMSLSALRPRLFQLARELENSREFLTLELSRRTVALLIPPPPEVADGIRVMFDPVAGHWVGVPSAPKVDGSTFGDIFAAETPEGAP
jgi:hypothetical protein